MCRGTFYIPTQLTVHVLLQFPFGLNVTLARLYTITKVTYNYWMNYSQNSFNLLHCLTAKKCIFQLMYTRLNSNAHVKAYFISYSFLWRKYECCNTRILLLKILMKNIKLSITPINVPFLITYTNMYLVKKKHTIKESKDFTKFNTNIFQSFM